MKFSIGIDIEKTKKFKSSKKNNQLINLLFSEKEIEYCQNKKEPHLAFSGKFCAKEAVVKALKGKVDIKKVEILNSAKGEPEIYISGKKRPEIECSISHIDDLAIAIVIILE